MGNLAPGYYSIEFKPITGWSLPATQTVSVFANDRTNISARYLKTKQPRARFNANPRSGFTPLEVQFTDISKPGTAPIQSWEWDFDSDGVVDSTAQNPLRTFSLSNFYDVTLRVVTSVGMSSLTRQSYIYSVLPEAPVADFTLSTSSGLPPLTVQFTDTSQPGNSSIDAWEWDFESDGIIDSTEQNPLQLFSDVGEYEVSLTVHSASGTDAVLRHRTLRLGQIALPSGKPLEMVWIPAGSFLMGAPENEVGSYAQERPQHVVTLAKGFWLGKYEITKGQWIALMNSTPWNMGPNVNYNYDSPAEFVSWYDAISFTNALNQHMLATGQGNATFHLPSESQWEYACRAGTSSRYYWGDDLDNSQIGNYIWQTDSVQIVGQKIPNAFGLHDMAGNAKEWCQDWYRNNYENATTDGSPWEEWPQQYRIIRPSFSCRSASRYGSGVPSLAMYGIGFRMAHAE
ncbi:MAG: SUMF1/EgtB/PvdO family nonheme iron enzyme [Candidatus Hydrogenedentes bacterium]|nr:SUMF1/EgtB/PvdO family nonheme iron enzyme [Candidatus Hydrogenedentota bacterium]